jgi:hypothetical protein
VVANVLHIPTFRTNIFFIIQLTRREIDVRLSADKAVLVCTRAILARAKNASSAYVLLAEPHEILDPETATALVVRLARLSMYELWHQ